MNASPVADFPSTAELVEGIQNADRARMGQAISLVESELPLHRKQAEELLEELGPAAGKSWRIGITGVPGAGKSSFLEQLGLHITREREEKVAVLAIDPSSPISGGSILGDKTRMNDLARDPRAFIRPSPSGGTFGGVARRSQEIIRICEAAGFQYCFIETVGVGQSEDLVKKLSDVMILLMITGAGDQLQGIKRGIMEVADLVLVNKADGSNIVPAKKTLAELRQSAAMLPLPAHGRPVVSDTCTSLDQRDMPRIWTHLMDHFNSVVASGWLKENRDTQDRYWVRAQLNEWVQDELDHWLENDPEASALLSSQSSKLPFGRSAELFRRYQRLRGTND